ncbi:MAG: hypothetical protein QW343_01675 [Candidatus Norongarragalinales archaeon]
MTWSEALIVLLLAAFFFTDLRYEVQSLFLPLLYDSWFLAIAILAALTFASMEFPR